MTNRSKNKGTAGETAVVRVARANGFPLADRLTLGGARTGHDRGDVLLTVGLMAQVKAGDAAKSASWLTISGWLAETEQQRVNGGHDVALLVLQQRGVGVDRAHLWECWLRHDQIHDDGWTNVEMLLLGDALTHLRKAGWGDPL